MENHSHQEADAIGGTENRMIRKALQKMKPNDDYGRDLVIEVVKT